MSLLSVIIEFHPWISEIDVSTGASSCWLTISENLVAGVVTSNFCTSLAAVGFKTLGLYSHSLPCHVWYQL